MKCEKCGSELRDGSVYCPECGKKVKKARKLPWYFSDGKDCFGDEFGANCLLTFDIVTITPLMAWIGNLLFFNMRIVSAFAVAAFAILVIINVVIHVLLGICNGERRDRDDSDTKYAWIIGVAFLIIVAFGLLASWIFETIMGTFPDAFNGWLNAAILSLILTVILVVLSKVLFWRY